MSEWTVIKGLSDGENALYRRLVEQLMSKQRRNLLRSSYYDGRRAVRQVGTTIPPQYVNMGLALGWAAKGVDGLARRCNIDEVYWTGGDLDALGMPELEESNFLFSELSQARTDSLIHGISYLVTTKGANDEPKALVHAKSALDGTGDYSARTRKMENFLSVTSRNDDEITGFVLYLPGETISVVKVGREWDVSRSSHGFGVPVEQLVYRPRKSRTQGRSRISRPVMSHQDSALRALLRLEGHMDIYAVPKLVMLGADESIFKNADGSPKASWQVAFGRAFGIPDDEDATNTRADVKQFSAESPEPHLAQLNALAKLMARETDLPDSDFALTDMANPTSADSITEARGNLVAEAEGAQDDWSPSIRRTIQRALAIQNDLSSVPESWRSIALDWRSPLHLSKAAAADAGAKQLGAGPEWLKDTKVGLKLLGIERKLIDQAIAERDANERRTVGRAVLAALPPRGQVAAAQVTSDANAG